MKHTTVAAISALMELASSEVCADTVTNWNQTAMEVLIAAKPRDQSLRARVSDGACGHVRRDQFSARTVHALHRDDPLRAQRVRRRRSGAADPDPAVSESGGARSYLCDSNPSILGNECRDRVAMVMLFSNSGECSSQPARRARRQRTRKACGLARNRRVRGQQGRLGDSARDRPRVVRELRTSTFQFDSSIHSSCANSAD